MPVRGETESDRFSTNRAEAALDEHGAQDMLIRATARATPGEFAINHDGGNASDAVMLRFGSHFGLLHIVDHYLMRRSSKALNYLDCFLAR